MPLPLIGLGLFLMRSSISGLLFGGILTMAAMHLWPDKMAIPYAWIGQGLNMLGL